MSILLKYWPYIAGAFLVIACGTYIHHKGVIAGRAQIQATFDAYVSASDAVVAQQRADNEQKLKDAETTNAQALALLSTQRDNAVTYGRSIAGKLRDYYAQANSSPVPKAGDQPGTDAAPKTPSDTGLTEAVGAVITECFDNEAQLTALQAELAPQL